MNKNEKLKILSKAFGFYGYQAQMLMAIEELSELVVALCHYNRGKAGMRSVIDEIADVHIILLQVTAVFPKEEIEKRIEWKLERLKKRIETDESQG